MTAAYFEDHPTDPDKMIMRKPHLDIEGPLHVVCRCPACKTALEAKDEPVAWISPSELLVMRGNALGGAKDWRVNVGLKPEDGDVGLYTTPPQRTWVGLTDEEIDKAWRSVDYTVPWDQHRIDIARAIETKLRSKNG